MWKQITETLKSYLELPTIVALNNFYQLYGQVTFQVMYHNRFFYNKQKMGGMSESCDLFFFKGYSI